MIPADLLYEVFDHSVPLSDRAKYGVYILRLCKGHDWYYQIIDDRFPVSVSNNKPSFATCNDQGEIWVPLIEKAFAKLHGCYESLIGGTVPSCCDVVTD